ncbi:hypothetical protein OG914_12495 [Streptomyces sp. NBC_00291]|uniref:hypothetical protein n=1 Tax=Streptomyces sp. NBC_00291 TaxID=2975704 RepID=UPI00224CE7CB|nr:hypothetical protein [Streptomyces sp. NBC_00291]MCX5154805.1 hypothetical protein [Streptomyces sp. NBC_00291]
MLKATVQTSIRLRGWTDTVMTSIRKRCTTTDRGQTAFEYLGIILVVVVIIGAIVGSGIGGEITKRIKEAVLNIKSG